VNIIKSSSTAQNGPSTKVNWSIGTAIHVCSSVFNIIWQVITLTAELLVSALPATLADLLLEVEAVTALHCTALHCTAFSCTELN
jgi:hypothetical protein